MLEHTTPATSAKSFGPPFRRILCAFDGGRAAATAALQAIALAADADLTFAAVETDGSVVSRHVWQELEELVEQARAGKVDARARLISAGSAADGLLAASAAYDLLVAGAPAHSRAAGVISRSTATALLHRARLPIMVARERPLRSGVLAATDGHPSARPALTAAALAARRFGAPLTVLHVHELDDRARRPELAAELANVRALLGRDLEYVVAHGGAAPCILAAAASRAPGLVVLGSASKRGAAAAASTSERVAHGAPCSVLVLRGA